MASSQGTDADKSSLRGNYLRVRKTLPAEARKRCDERVRRALAGLVYFAEAPVVLTYVSFGPEVDTRALTRELLAQGRRVAVPRCDPASRRMEFCEVGSLEELVPGAHGILEPAPGADALTVPQMVRSVCLVPGLVFDAAGFRVGYGGGYYDRFLPFYPGHKVGLARTAMISSNPLPHDPTDVPMDFIATEGVVWNCRDCR